MIMTLNKTVVVVLSLFFASLSSTTDAFTGQRNVRTSNGPSSTTAVRMSTDYYKRSALARANKSTTSTVSVIETPSVATPEKTPESTVEEQQEKLVSILQKEKEVLENTESSSSTTEEVKEESIFPTSEKGKKEVEYYKRPGSEDREAAAAAIVKETGGSRRLKALSKARTT